MVFVVKCYFVVIFTGSKRSRMEMIDDEDTQDLFEKQSRADLASRVMKNVSKTRPQCENCSKMVQTKETSISQI